MLPDGTNQNKVFGTNGIGLNFIGKLPNFISFNVDSPHQAEASFFYVYGENNELLFIQHSNGWTGFEETSTPYIPSELISITTATRITGVYILSLYNLRTGPTIDNLTFEYRELPEPSTLLLLMTGIAGIFLARIKCKSH